MKVLIATNNQGKLKEFRRLLGSYFSDFCTPADLGLTLEVEEDGVTFEENALKKAREAMQISQMAALADDSGLEVDALDGRPGVYSARYSGEGDEGNNRLLLKELENVPTEQRTARYVCCVALCLPDGRVFTGKGASEGRILTEPAGTGGFGYDPLFFDVASGQSYAQMSMEEKNQISHRVRAIQDLQSKLHEAEIG